MHDENHNHNRNHQSPKDDSELTFLDGFNSDGVPEDMALNEINGNANGAMNNMLAVDAEDSAEWQETIENVVKSVVSIHFCQTASFDTDLSMASQATGFVVDAERGYILTNRHVVCSGPFWGYCIFDNHEEVSIYPSSVSLGPMIVVMCSAEFCALIV